MKEFQDLVRSLTQSFQALGDLVEKMKEKLETVAETKAPTAPARKRTPAKAEKKAPAKTEKKAPARKVVAKTAKPARKAAVEKPVRKVVAKKPVQKPAKRTRVKAGSTIVEAVRNVIEDNPGIDMKSLQEKTGFDMKQLQNTVFRLKKLGKIKVEGRGVYYPVSVRVTPVLPVEQPQEVEHPQE